MPPKTHGRGAAAASAKRKGKLPVRAEATEMLMSQNEPSSYQQPSGDPATVPADTAQPPPPPPPKKTRKKSDQPQAAQSFRGLRPLNPAASGSNVRSFVEPPPSPLYLDAAEGDICGNIGLQIHEDTVPYRNDLALAKYITYVERDVHTLRSQEEEHHRGNQASFRSYSDVVKNLRAAPNLAQNRDFRNVYDTVEEQVQQIAAVREGQRTLEERLEGIEEQMARLETSEGGINELSSPTLPSLRQRSSQGVGEHQPPYTSEEPPPISPTLARPMPTLTRPSSSALTRGGVPQGHQPSSVDARQRMPPPPCPANQSAQSGVSRKHAASPPQLASTSPAKRLKDDDTPKKVYIGPMPEWVTASPSVQFSTLIEGLTDYDIWDNGRIHVLNTTGNRNGNVIEVLWRTRTLAEGFCRVWSDNPPPQAPVNSIAVMSSDAGLASMWPHLRAQPQQTWDEKRRGPVAGPSRATAPARYGTGLDVYTGHESCDVMDTISPAVTISRTRYNLDAFAHVNGDMDTAIKSVCQTAKIGIWNMKGHLASRIRQNNYAKQLCKYDILVLTETWLLPEQESTLPLPKGFGIIASSRGIQADLRSAHGGVAVLYRLELPVVKRMTLPIAYSHDIIGVDFGEFVLLAAYVPPEGKRWVSRQEISPEDIYENAVRFVESLKRPTIITGDFNCRTGNLQTASYSEYQRIANDEVINARGRRFIGLWGELGFMVVNGTSFEEILPGALTSFNKMGAATVDYVVVNGLARNLIPLGALEVMYAPFVEAGLSDHSLLVLSVTMKETVNKPRPEKMMGRKLTGSEVLAERLGRRGQAATMELDKTIADLIADATSFAASTRRMYGPVETQRNMPALNAHIAPYHDRDEGWCAGIYLGASAEINRGFNVKSLRKQTTETPVYVGILYLLTNTPPQRNVVAYVPSRKVIRMIAYEAADMRSQKWGTADGFIIRRICEGVRRRMGFLDLRWYDEANRNKQAQAAWALARDYCGNSVSGILPQWLLDRSHVDEMLEWGKTAVPVQKAKVITSVPEEAPKDKPQTRPVKVNPGDVEIEDNEGLSSDDLSEPNPERKNHRGRAELRKWEAENLNNLIGSPTLGVFWKQVKDFQDPKKQATLVDTEQLQLVFQNRLNPPKERAYSAEVIAAQQRASDIPDSTIDVSENGVFSRPVTEDEVDAVKAKLKKQSSNAASTPGADGVQVQHLLRIDSGDMAKVINQCITTQSLPTSWLCTVLVGIPKVGKDASDPDSYRLIGLESCFLKFVMQIFDRRLKEWAESISLLPESQNGFRPGYRTNNNSFILRTAIDQARARKRPLYVIFVDLKNAFPSTVIGVLWTKLYEKGARGPFVDWVRRLYREMEYIVRHERCFGDFFQSIIGLLTGDNSSPTLWNVYFADLDIPPLSNDVWIGGRRVSHLEQADDLVLLSYSADELQRKIEGVMGWCERNGMEVSISKTKWMWFGRLPSPKPVFKAIDGLLIEEVPSYKYVGIRFGNNPRKSMFSAHYDDITRKAQATAGATLALRSFVGQIPPHEGRAIYHGRIDPHLVNGAEIAIDVVLLEKEKLVNIQKWFLRRLLRLSKSSLIFPLYTELNIMPVQHRRLHLAFRYLAYLVAIPADRLASAALRESIVINQQFGSGWLAELSMALERAEAHVTWNVNTLVNPSLTVEERLQHVNKCAEDILESIRNDLRVKLQGCDRVILGKERRVLSGKGIQPYLRIPNPRHRDALLRLLSASHRLAVEAGRGQVNREDRICRLCHNDVEDEVHILLSCVANAQLVLERQDFCQLVRGSFPRIASKLESEDRQQQISGLNMLLRLKDLEHLEPFGRYVSFTLGLVYEAPMYLRRQAAVV